MKKTLSIVLVLLLCLFTASAFEDFSVATEPIVSVCACTTQNIPVTLTNANALDQSKTFIIGDSTTESIESSGVPSTYSIAYSGTGGAFATAVPPAFGLSSGQAGTFNTQVGVPCDAQGVYDLGTTITTGQGLTKSFSQTLSVSQCSNLGVSQGSSLSKQCPCTPAVFTFALQNAGTFVETYDLFIESELAEYITLSEHPILLSPGQTKQISLFVNSPCDLFGVYDIDVLITARSSGQEFWKNFKAEFDQACYDYDISLGEAQVRSENNSIPFEPFAGTYEMCELEEVLVPIKLLHTSNISNAYDLTLDAEEWVSISKDHAELNKNQQTFFVVKLIAPEGVNNNETQFVFIKTALGDLEKRGDLKIQAESCYLPDIAEEEVTITSEGLLNVFTLENKGTRDAVYTISIKGESWITPEVPTLTVGAGETTELKIKTIPGEAEEGEYTATVVFTAENGVSYERQIEFKLKNVTYEDYVPYIIALLLLLLPIFLIWKDKQPAKRKIVKAAPQKKKRKKLRWGRIIFIILVLLIGAGAIAGVIQFKDKVTEKLGDNTLDVSKPLIVQPGAIPPSEDSEVIEKLKSFEPFPYFWYTILGILVVVLVIGINESKRRKGKPPKKEKVVEKVPPKVSEVKEIKEVKVEPKVVPKVVKPTENVVSGGMMRFWKWYLLLIVIIIAGLLAYLLWPGVYSSAIATVTETVKGMFASTAEEVVVEPVKDGSFLSNPLWAILLGVGLLVILIVVLEFFRRKKQGSSEKKVVPKPVKKVAKVEPSKAKVVKKEPKKVVKSSSEKKNWKVFIWPLLLLLVICAAIVGVRMTGEAQHTLVETTDEPDIIREVKTDPIVNAECDKNFISGQAQQLDLQKSFQDPDNDELTFSASNPKNFDVTIVNGIATLTPDKGFTGVEHIVFSAEDTEGNEASSGILTLCVEKGKFNPFAGFSFDFKGIGSYWVYIVIGLAILGVIILLHKNKKSIMKFLEEEDNGSSKDTKNSK
jgi:hypothetical protein